MSTPLVEALDARITETHRLRRECQAPPMSDGPVAVLTALVDARARLDRVEELLSEVLRLRNSARRLARAAKDEVDDAWAAKVAGPGGRRSRGDFGDPAPRERYAEADLAVLEQRRRERQYAEQLAQAEEATEFVQLAHRGLSEVRRDLHVMLRAMEVERSLER